MMPFHRLFELGPDHLVCSPNYRANLLAQIRGNQHEFAWNSVGIEKSYLYAAGRNIMDEATQHGVLVHRNRTALLHAAPRLRSTFFRVSHHCTLWIGHLSPGLCNDAQKRSLKFSASPLIHAPVMRLRFAGFADVAEHSDMPGARP